MVKLRLKLAHAMMPRSWLYHIHGRSRRPPPTASDSDNDDGSSTNLPVIAHRHDNPMYTETSAGSSMPTSDGESPSPSPLSPATQNPAFRLDVQELNRKLGALSSDERQKSVRRQRSLRRLSDVSPPSTDDAGSPSNSGRVRRHPPEEIEEGVLESGGFSGTAVVGKFAGIKPAVGDLAGTMEQAAGDLAGTNIKPTIGHLAVTNTPAMGDLSNTKPSIGNLDGTVPDVGCSAGLRQYCRQEKAQRRPAVAGRIRRNADGSMETSNYRIFKMAQLRLEKAATFADKYVVGAAMTESTSTATEGDGDSSSAAEKWLKEESRDDRRDYGRKLSVYARSSDRRRACQAAHPQSAQIPLSVKPTRIVKGPSSVKPSIAMTIPNPLVPKEAYKHHKCNSNKDVHPPLNNHQTIEESSPSNKNPHHRSCFPNKGNAKIADLIVHESTAMVKNSYDPLFDFKESMLEMILSNDLHKMADLVELLQCYLALNSDHYHHTIVKAFYEVVWCDTSGYQS